MSERNNFISGITELLILSILKHHDSYAYEITKGIETNSDGLLSISQNTIYTAIYKLQNEGKITEEHRLVGKRRIRVYYQIEDSGIAYLNELQKVYDQTTIGVQKIMTYLDNTESVPDG